jgi:dATP pyrophosphohydrolase
VRHLWKPQREKPGKKLEYLRTFDWLFWIRLKQVNISKEHIEYKWVNYEEAVKMLKWDSNKNALWELNECLLRSERSKS